MSAHPRYRALDLIRGAAVAGMIVGHTRYFFLKRAYDPFAPGGSDLMAAPLLLISYFATATFLLVCGVSARLLLANKGVSDARPIFIRRGLLLLVLEVTVVKWSWHFQLNLTYYHLQALWALGIGLLVFALIGGARKFFVALLGVTIIITHNLFDSVALPHGGVGEWLARALKYGGTVDGALTIRFGYPVLPWLGIMLVGFAVGDALVRLSPRWLVALGLGFLTLFGFARTYGWYGDPYPWVCYQHLTYCVHSFIGPSKHPPSLQFVMGSFGLFALVFALAHRRWGIVERGLLLLGQHSLFAYLIHLPLIHGVALGGALLFGFSGRFMFSRTPRSAFPVTYGVSPEVVFLLALLFIALITSMTWWWHRHQRLNR